MNGDILNENIDCIDCIFRIPNDRMHCSDWLRQQTPETIADVLDVSRSMYMAMISGIHNNKEIEQDNLNVEEAHKQSLKKATKLFTDRIEALKLAHDQALETNNNQIQDLELKLADTKSSFSLQLYEEVRKQGECIAREKDSQLRNLETVQTRQLEAQKEQYDEQEKHQARMNVQYIQANASQKEDLREQHETEVITLKKKDYSTDRRA